MSKVIVDKSMRIETENRMEVPTMRQNDPKGEYECHFLSFLLTV